MTGIREVIEQADREYVTAALTALRREGMTYTDQAKEALRPFAVKRFFDPEVAALCKMVEYLAAEVDAR